MKLGIYKGENMRIDVSKIKLSKNDLDKLLLKSMSEHKLEVKTKNYHCN